MSEFAKALSLIQQMKSVYKAFEHAEAVIAAAASAEAIAAERERLAKEHAESIAEQKAEAAKLETDLDAAVQRGNERIKEANAAIATAEAARDRALSDALAVTAEARQLLAAEVSAFRAKCEAETAALGKQVAALRDERDSLERALSELKRLAAR